MTEEREPSPGTPHDLIRLGIALSAVTVALASLQPESPIAPIFLLSGFGAAIGTGYAVAQLWKDSELTFWDMFPRRRPEWLDLRYEALVYIIWAMVGLTITIVAFLFIR